MKFMRIPFVLLKMSRLIIDNAYIKQVLYMFYPMQNHLSQKVH